jgi:NTE family protein
MQNKPPSGPSPKPASPSSNATPTTPHPSTPTTPATPGPSAPLRAQSAPLEPVFVVEPGPQPARAGRFTGMRPPRIIRRRATPGEATETAVVITGAVAQGAFAAGALEVLARQSVQIHRVVATSAGALTGTLLAAGIHAGRVDEAAGALVDLWTRDAHWRNALDLSLRDVLRGRGLSTTRSLHRVLRTAVESMVPRDRQAIELHLIATALQGNPMVRRYEHRTCAEVVFRFHASDFETRGRRDRIYNAATASAAFPGLYAPVHVPGVGDCIDGGAVNNAAIKRALAGSNVGRVIVIANTPKLARTPPLAGVKLAEHIVGTVLHERLYRDLREAVTVNNQLAALESLVPCGVVNAAQLEAVKDALGWEQRRILSLVEIRPPAPLRGGAFTALSDRSLREGYIEEGRRAAEEALASPRYRTFQDVMHEPGLGGPEVDEAGGDDDVGTAYALDDIDAVAPHWP